METMGEGGRGREKVRTITRRFFLPPRQEEEEVLPQSYMPTSLTCSLPSVPAFLLPNTHPPLCRRLLLFPSPPSHIPLPSPALTRPCCCICRSGRSIWCQVDLCGQQHNAVVAHHVEQPR